MTVIVDHTYGPIRILHPDPISAVPHADSRHIHQAVMSVSVPAMLDGTEFGIFGRAEIIWDGGKILLRVAHSCWPTIACGGCEIEWQRDGRNWQARIDGGQINGFAVAERGEMAFTK